MKGATKSRTGTNRRCIYFNPRTREGCDLPGYCTWRYGLYFNPRTREGCDTIFVSKKQYFFHFNPRTREGCDSIIHVLTMDDGISIHAPVKGATRRQVGRRGYGYYFNPRTREGCDCRCTARRRVPCAISIHAPVKGATGIRYSRLPDHGAISIHAPVKGATWRRVLSKSCWPTFQSTHP